MIRKAWEEGRIGYEGRRWRFEDLPFGPPPSGRISINIGTGAAIDRAGRMGDGFLDSAGRGVFAKIYRTLREGLERHGRAEEKFPYVASSTFYVHEDAERAKAEVAITISSYQRSCYAEWGTDRGEPKPGPIRPEELSGERYFVGDPDEVTEALIQLYQEGPYDHLCFWGRLPGLSRERALESMRLFAFEVATRVREMVGAA